MGSVLVLFCSVFPRGSWPAPQPWSAEQGAPGTCRCVAAGIAAVPSAGLQGRGPGPLAGDRSPGQGRSCQWACCVRPRASGWERRERRPSGQGPVPGAVHRGPGDRLPMKLCINDLKEIHTPSFVLRVLLVLLSNALRPGLALSAPFPSLRGWGAQVITASGQVVPGLWGRSARDGGQRTRGRWALPAGARASAPAQVSPSASPRRGHMADPRECRGWPPG